MRAGLAARRLQDAVNVLHAVLLHSITHLVRGRRRPESGEEKCRSPRKERFLQRMNYKQISIGLRTSIVAYFPVWRPLREGTLKSRTSSSPGTKYRRLGGAATARCCTTSATSSGPAITVSLSCAPSSEGPVAAATVPSVRPSIPQGSAAALRRAFFYVMHRAVCKNRTGRGGAFIHWFCLLCSRRRKKETCAPRTARSAQTTNESSVSNSPAASAHTPQLMRCNNSSHPADRCPVRCLLTHLAQLALISSAAGGGGGATCPVAIRFKRSTSQQPTTGRTMNEF